MDGTAIAVVVGSAFAALFVLWFFFGARDEAPVRLSEAGFQEVDVTIEGTLRPGRIALRRDVPVRLRVLRLERGAAAAELSVEALGVRRELPLGRVVEIDLPGLAPGSYDLVCGLSMLRGKLVVKG